MYKLLTTINISNQLKQLTVEQLILLAQELRHYLIDSVSKTGGHFASNLGCVELTIALHYIYNTPEDLLVWDVGHQTYAHKILTGRMAHMNTIRQFKGLSGFPNIKESQYDSFGVGHSSTSISAALGMAVANSLQAKNNKTVAIIGDGGMTAGLAFEGLNNAGWLKKNLLIILNDNEMSISENVGAMSSYLAKILSSRFYHNLKQSAHEGMRHLPIMRELAHKVEEQIKGWVHSSSTLFEEFGFNYTGPIDGHDLPTLINVLNQIKNLSGSQFLHIVTKKGQGYKLAEESPIQYHGVNNFDIKQGLTKLVTTKNKQLSDLSYTQVFSQWLCDQAKLKDNFVAITPAMREGSGLVEFAKQYPHRFFDVGIAEQHAVTFAAGIASQGIKPIVAIYSTFLQRAYDQLIHDVALQNLPVLFAIDRAGIVGADGATHMGAFDLSYMRCIPNLVIIAPSSQQECYDSLDFGYNLNLPVAIRYPRGKGLNNNNYTDLQHQTTPFALGKAKILKTANHKNKKIAFLAFGSMVNIAFELAEEFEATCIDMRFIKPLDESIIINTAQSHQLLVLLEENALLGGSTSACLEVLVAAFTIKQINIMPQVLRFGLPDTFIEHGDVNLLIDEIGISKEKIKSDIIALQTL